MALPGSIYDFSPPTRDWTHVPYFGSRVLITGPPGKFQQRLFLKKEGRDRKRKGIIDSDDGKKERENEGKEGRWWGQVMKRREGGRTSDKGEVVGRREGWRERRMEEIQSWPGGGWAFDKWPVYPFPREYASQEWIPVWNPCMDRKLDKMAFKVLSKFIF